MRQSLFNGWKGTSNEDVTFCQFNVCGDTTRMQYVCACMICVCVCVPACEGVLAHVYVCRVQRLILSVFVNCPSLELLRQGLSLVDLALTDG